MRRKALDCERTRDAHSGLVVIRLVVQVLELSLCSDRRIDFDLSPDAGFQPLAVELPSRLGPPGVWLIGNLPLSPTLFQLRVDSRKQRIQRGLPLLPNDV